MKKLFVRLHFLLILGLGTSKGFAQMGSNQGGGMMGNGFGWVSIIIIAILVILGIGYMVKQNKNILPVNVIHITDQNQTVHQFASKWLYRKDHRQRRQ